MTIAILAGLITWLVTTIIVESEITRPLRDFFKRQGDAERLTSALDAAMFDLLLRGDRTALDAGPPRRNPLRLLSDKVAYLLTCHLCTGLWVGLVVATIVTGPFGNVILDGLAYKGVGHLVLAAVNFLDGYKGEVVVNNYITEPDPTPTVSLPSRADGFRVP